MKEKEELLLTGSSVEDGNDAGSCERDDCCWDTEGTD